MGFKIINKININILYFCKLSRKNYFLSRQMTRQNHSHYGQGAGEGLSVTWMLLYLDPYKKWRFERMRLRKESITDHAQS